jgi:hypothetical protein
MNILLGEFSSEVEWEDIFKDITENKLYVK